MGEHIEALRDAGRRLLDVVAGADLDAPVPPCPGWDVRELVRHLGGVHRWATRYVSEARTAVIDADLDEIVRRWPGDAELLDWFADGHQTLLDALVNAPPDLDCFTFLEAPSPLAMWARRQAHETSIHRVDAESAVGAVTPFPTRLASDGIDELVTAFITRPGRGPRSPSEKSLAVVPRDDP
ncbi:MAG: maleylpyruvate isomerase family mycothiol-dependent enzyme, partial [Gemmatimonadota bacterium]|nr:maleylpyruvate isomerase family mycothiol-dependent enzyme [Gemmatimonadota bacterium]